MITVRPSEERGHTRLQWLDSRRTFSFDQYRDPKHVSFRSLRVINQDRVEPGAGFGTHPHRDMEILTWVLDGALEHKDSLGTGSVIRPGDIQKMTAGTGIMHSEINHSETDPVHFLQVWIFPARRDLKPGYQQVSYEREQMRNTLLLIASGEDSSSAVHVNQDIELYASVVDRGEKVVHALRPERHAWLQITKGALALNGYELESGDGAAVSGEERLEISVTEAAEFLLFDLA